MITSPR